MLRAPAAPRRAERRRAQLCCGGSGLATDARGGCRGGSTCPGPARRDRPARGSWPVRAPALAAQLEGTRDGQRSGERWPRGGRARRRGKRWKALARRGAQPGSGGEFRRRNHLFEEEGGHRLRDRGRGARSRDRGPARRRAPSGMTWVRASLAASSLSSTRRPVRGHQRPRDRPRPAVRARRQADGGEPPDRLPRLQPARGPTGLRRRGDGPLCPSEVSSAGARSGSRAHGFRSTGPASPAARVPPGHLGSATRTVPGPLDPRP
jgi:hypothetical protein